MSASPRRTNTRVLVVGLLLLGLIVFSLAAAFVVARMARPAVGLDGTVGAGTQTGQSVTQPPAPAAVVVRTESDISRLRTPLEQDIARAYFRYWAVYAAAMESLDTSRLAEVTAGGRHHEAVAEVDDVKADGVAAKIQVSHSVSIVQASETEATLRDEYVDSSYAIDPVTRAPVGQPGPSDRVVNVYFLRRVDGVWKVVGGRRDAP